MPKKIASAAKRVLLHTGLAIVVFEKIKNLHILLRLRLVCKLWSKRILFLNRSVYKIYTDKDLIKSAYHRILHIRKDIKGWYGARNYVPLITLHKSGNN